MLALSNGGACQCQCGLGVYECLQSMIWMPLLKGGLCSEQKHWSGAHASRAFSPTICSTLVYEQGSQPVFVICILFYSTLLSSFHSQSL